MLPWYDIDLHVYVHVYVLHYTNSSTRTRVRTRVLLVLEYMSALNTRVLEYTVLRVHVYRGTYAGSRLHGTYRYSNGIAQHTHTCVYLYMCTRVLGYIGVRNVYRVYHMVCTASRSHASAGADVHGTPLHTSDAHLFPEPLARRPPPRVRRPRRLACLPPCSVLSCPPPSRPPSSLVGVLVP
jgi:hypothetical protein